MVPLVQMHRQLRGGGFSILSSVVVGLLLCSWVGSAAYADVVVTRIISTSDGASQPVKPVYVTSPPDDPSRLFLVERGEGTTARIWIWNPQTDTVNNAPFLTLGGLKTGGVDQSQGLLGMAFHPDYVSNGKFYLHYTVPGGLPHTCGNSLDIQKVVEYQTLNADQADSASARTLFSYEQPFESHNAGWLDFSPVDGYLYIPIGDGGQGGDPCNYAQTFDADRPLLGKLLRIDVDGTNKGQYGVPLTNPFYTGVGDQNPLDDEAWAIGLRNPWRGSFDRKTGDLYIADVGELNLEEVNFQPANSTGGENYGWRVKEGTTCFDNSQFGGNPPCNDASLVDPIYEYSHDYSNPNNLGGVSITGGYVYRGPIDSLQGNYFFADYVFSRIWSLMYDGTTASNFVNRTTTLNPTGYALDYISSFGEDALGNLYITDFLNGEVFKVIDDSVEDHYWSSTTSLNFWDSASNWTSTQTPQANWIANVWNTSNSSGQTVLALGPSSHSSSIVDELNIFGISGPMTVLVQSGAGLVANHIRVGYGGQMKLSGFLGSLETSILSLEEGSLTGDGVFSGMLTNAGTVAPGNPTGVLTIAGDYTQDRLGVLEIELGGLTAGTDYDQLVITGQADLNGTLSVSSVNTFVPALGNRFQLLTAANISGTFAVEDFSAASLPPALQWVLDDSDPAILALEVLATQPGDFTGDGQVDPADFAILAENWLLAGNPATGDANGDGQVDPSDFAILAGNWLVGIVAVSASSQPLPEPASLALAFLATLAATPMVLRSRSRPFKPSS